MRLLSYTLLASVIACAPPSQEQLDSTRGSRMDVYFNEPGTRAANMWEPDVINVMVDMIDNARTKIDFAVMGFNRREVYEAFVRAYDRGVQVRMVGDAGHLYNSGYQLMIQRHIPMVTGNDTHLMHNKFMVIDDRFVFGSTANWTDTDLRHNSNNFFTIDHPEVANDFTVEFEQMFNGAFGHTKKEILNGRSYMVGDTLVEVWFSPNEDAVGRILEVIDGAQESVRFAIFAFTKDQIGSSFIRLQDRLRSQGITPGGDPTTTDFRGVAGMIDRSQLHSNGQYTEVFRLLGDQATMLLDGNDNSQQPGDYQAGGGRMHSKTMIIDVGGENPIVISGSFNWSSSATVSNDEYLLVMHGDRVANAYLQYQNDLWMNGKPFGQDFIGENGTGDVPLSPGDLLINEIQWYGGYSITDENGLLYEDRDGNDEFIELYNTTDRAISLEMWQLATQEDFVMGFPPGAIIGPKSTFLVLDHQLEAYVDGVPQDQLSGYRNGDLVLNAYNDNRQARLYLKDGELELILKDPRNQVMDRAGNATPAFHGGPSAGVVRSMERRTLTPGDGTSPADWKACEAAEGGDNVNELFRGTLLATPGQVNSNMVVP